MASESTNRPGVGIGASTRLGPSRGNFDFETVEAAETVEALTLTLLSATLPAAFEAKATRGTPRCRETLMLRAALRLREEAEAEEARWLRMLPPELVEPS